MVLPVPGAVAPSLGLAILGSTVLGMSMSSYVVLRLRDI
jgi:hypothetical protein